MIKFNKYNVTDTNTKVKAKVLYSLDNRVDGRKCVTIYAKDYTRNLGELFDNYTNETDTMTDYFDQGHIDLFEDSPYYVEARKRAERNEVEFALAYEKKLAKRAA